MNTSADDSIPTWHPSESALAGYLDGELSEDAIAELESHLELCPECRELLAGATTVLAEHTSQRDVPVAMTPKPDRLMTPIARRTSRRWRIAGLALAASIIAVLVARPIDRQIPAGESPIAMRLPGGDVGEGLQVLAVHSPSPGASVSRAALRFAWSPATAERFHLVVARDDGAPVFEADTRDTTLVLPDSVRLQSGSLYFWHADAIGSGLTASTRLQRFTVTAVP